MTSTVHLTSFHLRNNDAYCRSIIAWYTPFICHNYLKQLRCFDCFGMLICTTVHYHGPLSSELYHFLKDKLKTRKRMLCAALFC